MMTSTYHPDNITQNFVRHWEKVLTADNSLTRHRVRRSKTAHLINLRFLEEDIAALNDVIVQAGINTRLDTSSSDRLGRTHSQSVTENPRVEKSLREKLWKRRRLIGEFSDDALISFNQIMTMETFSLMDNDKQSSLHADRSMHEIYSTQLIRTELGTRSRREHFRCLIQKYLRDLRYWRLFKKDGHEEVPRQPQKSRQVRHLKTLLVAEVVGHLITALTIVIFLIVPPVILEHQYQSTQTVVFSIFVLLFLFIVTAMLRISTLEMMFISEAYAVVLATFVTSNA
ncbi:hypothetical protein F5Y03DRAFT_408947 [Xylaria venustula]|nr:hypothetical protein F5Y03DRAFT_408947 [Xylaria venustula]